MLLLFLEGGSSILDTIHNIAVPAQIPKSTPGIINKYIFYVNNEITSYILLVHELHNREQFHLLID